MSAACWGIGRLPVGVGTVLVVTGCFNDMADFFSCWVTKWVMRVGLEFRIRSLNRGLGHHCVAPEF